MKRILLISVTITSVNVYSGECLVPLSKIKVADVAIGESVNDLARRHKAVEVDKLIINNELDGKWSVFINNPQLEREWFYGEPVNNFNYIIYDRATYKIDSFGVAFSLDNFSFEKVQQTVINLYGLPVSGWVYSKENDPKYGEAKEYNYKCSDYSIRLAQSALGTSMQVSKK